MVWEAGHIMAKWAYKEKSLFEGKTVLEIGAGTGVTGFAAAKWAENLVFTDYDDKVMKLLLKNVELNKDLPAKMTCSQLDWFKACD